MIILRIVQQHFLLYNSSITISPSGLDLTLGNPPVLRFFETASTSEKAPTRPWPCSDFALHGAPSGN
jgi:hypothetical protein